MRGFIPDIYKTLSTYGLSKYWSHYVQFSEFPDKQPWKCIMKDAVAAHMLGLNSLKLSQKPGTHTVLNVYDLQHPSPLYHIAKSYPLESNNILRLNKLLTIPDNDLVKCDMCYRVTNFSVQHIMCECPLLNDRRNEMWDQICDEFGVEIAATLNNLPDEELVYTMLGRICNIFLINSDGIQLYEQFIILVAKTYGIMYDIINRHHSTQHNENQ